MERKIKLAKLIQLEVEGLKDTSQVGRVGLECKIALAEEITRDAIELANIVLAEGVDMQRIELKDQIAVLLADGIITFQADAEAAQAFDRAAQAALMNPNTTFKAEIAEHCDQYIENILRLVS